MYVHTCKCIVWHLEHDHWLGNLTNLYAFVYIYLSMHEYIYAYVYTNIYAYICVYLYI